MTLTLHSMIYMNCTLLARSHSANNFHGKSLIEACPQELNLHMGLPVSSMRLPGCCNILTCKLLCRHIESYL